MTQESPPQDKPFDAGVFEELEAITESYKVTSLGLELIIDPQVFPPKEDSEGLARSIGKPFGNRFSLNPGTGCGIAAIRLAKLGWEVIAADLSPDSVECARKNVKRHDVPVEVVLSNVFDQIPFKKVALIVANGPYADEPPKPNNNLELYQPNNNLKLARYGRQEFYTKLLAGGRERLSPDGKMLLGMVEVPEATQFLEALLGQYNYRFHVINRSSPDKYGAIFRVYEASIAA